MKSFLLKLTLFITIALVLLSAFLSRYGGYVDYFYNRFTTPRQFSLIIGDSKSFQGIKPSIINEELKNKFELPIYNYSFTLGQMAYGESLLKSIKAKMVENTSNALFILSVQPLILAERDKDDFKKGIYFEDEFPPNNMNFPNMNPNIEYLLKNGNYFHFKSIFKKSSFVHDDGWMEESNLTKDTAVLNSWKKEQVNLYKGIIKKWKKSQYRLDKLNETVAFLKKHGTVVLVRMPSNKPILDLEHQFWSDFDKNMQQISIQNKVSYFNYTLVKNPFQSYDGVHLDKYGGTEFTKSLCDSILSRN